MRISVIGSEGKGQEIAQIFLMKGHDVILSDLSRASLTQGKETIEKTLEQIYEMGVTSKPAEAYLSSKAGNRFGRRGQGLLASHRSQTRKNRAEAGALSRAGQVLSS